MRNFISNYYNYILASSLLAWLVAQILKTLLHFFSTKRFDAERLVGAGGMPSSHSALVCSATVAVSRKAGADSPELAIMFIIALIVMYDAMGVRRAAGMHAKEINRMNKYFEDNKIASGAENTDENEVRNKELKEFLGHTPFEVLGGALLGIIIALMVPVQ